MITYATTSYTLVWLIGLLNSINSLVQLSSYHKFVPVLPSNFDDSIVTIFIIHAKFAWKTSPWYFWEKHNHLKHQHGINMWLARGAFNRMVSGCWIPLDIYTDAHDDLTSWTYVPYYWPFVCTESVGISAHKKCDAELYYMALNFNPDSFLKDISMLYRRHPVLACWTMKKDTFLQRTV